MRSIKLSGLMMIAAALLLSTPAACVGASLPRLKVTDLKGSKENLQEYQEQGKIIVLNFWATWCGPCNEEMPMLVNEQAKYKTRGVQVIGVSIDKRSDEGKVRDFVAKYHIDFPIWVGGTGDDVSRWKLGPAVPATAFIQNGKVVGRVWGEMRQPSFEHRIEWLLGNHEGNPPEAVENNLDVKEK